MLACMSNLHPRRFDVPPSLLLHPCMSNLKISCLGQSYWIASWSTVTSSSLSRARFTGCWENVSPYPGAVTLAMSNELWGWLSNSFRCSWESTSKRSACRLKPQACREFTFSQLAFTPTTALRENFETEGRGNIVRPLSSNTEISKQAMSESLKKPPVLHLYLSLEVSYPQQNI